MKNNNVGFELQSRVRKYIEYTMENATNIEGENAVLNKLNTALKDEVLLESYGRLFETIPFFKENFSKKTNEMLAFSLKKLTLSPDEYLFHVVIFFLEKNEQHLFYN